MTREIKLSAKIRQNTDAKKEKDFIPAVMYGAKIKNQNLKINKIEFSKIYEIAGESNLIDLIVDNGAPVKIIIKEVQKDPLKSNIIHADFYQVDMEKEITTEIPFNFIGESKAEKQFGGVVNKNIDHVEIRCLPGKLVDHIDIDMSLLENINDAIKLNDLKLPEGISLVSDQNDAIINVTEKRKIEEKAEEVVEDVSKAKAGEDASKAKAVEEKK